MVNSILVGKIIYKLLLNDEPLGKLVNKQIYPLVADHDTKFPFITYSRDNITSLSCKDGYYEDQINFTVTVVSADYLGSLDIANRIREILEKRVIKSDFLTLDNVTLSGIDESYIDNAYVQSMSFVCKAH